MTVGVQSLAVVGFAGMAHDVCAGVTCAPARNGIAIISSVPPNKITVCFIFYNFDLDLLPRILRITEENVIQYPYGSIIYPTISISQYIFENKERKIYTVSI